MDVIFRQSDGIFDVVRKARNHHSVPQQGHGEESEESDLVDREVVGGLKPSAQQKEQV
jgi:hypothetical protein